MSGTTEARLTFTPSKSKYANDANCIRASKSEKSPDGMLLSPEQVPFAREIPPAISIKPRKVAGLFGRRECDYAKGLDKLKAPAVVDRVCDGVSSSYDDPEEGKASETMKLPASSFASPPRPTREQQVASDRFTPQRNLGDLFASPLRRSPSPTPADDIVLSPVARRVCKWQSPKRHAVSEQAASLSESEESEASNPLSALLCPTKATAEKDTAGADEDVTAEEAVETARAENVGAGTQTKAEPATDPRTEGDTPSVPKNEVPVSNEALRSVESSEICTLEVLVRHTRERVGVSALLSWTVAELKRRLVFLKLFSDAGRITLKPRFEEDLLEDNQKLGALDADVTYEARTAPMA